MWRIASTSLEYIGPITIPGATAGMPVEIAVIARGLDEPAESDWHAATSWNGTEAFLLVGPGVGGAMVLTDGAYQVFARVTAPPEKPVIEVEDGFVRVT